jgi:hypothetical protein
MFESELAMVAVRAHYQKTTASVNSSNEHSTFTLSLFCDPRNLNTVVIPSERGCYRCPWLACNRMRTKLRPMLTRANDGASERVGRRCSHAWETGGNPDLSDRRGISWAKDSIKSSTAMTTGRSGWSATAARLLDENHSANCMLGEQFSEETIRHDQYGTKHYGSIPQRRSRPLQRGVVEGVVSLVMGLQPMTAG